MKEKKKSLIEAATLTSAFLFVLKSAASAIAGWVGLTLFQAAWEKTKSWFKRCKGGTGNEHSEGIPQAEQKPET